jgi:hypothetical protein
VQPGVELPHQAIRFQIADCLRLVMHLERTEGVRVLTGLIRVDAYARS